VYVTTWRGSVAVTSALVTKSASACGVPCWSRVNICGSVASAMVVVSWSASDW
jgi:hypothetical protein